MQDPEDDPRTLPMNNDGSVTNRQARYGVYTSSRYHSDGIVKDHSVLASVTQYLGGHTTSGLTASKGLHAKDLWITQMAKLDGQRNIWWQKVCENIDKGGWGNDGVECNGSSVQIIMWGDSVATFRWDNGDNIDIKNGDMANESEGYWSILSVYLFVHSDWIIL